MGASTDPTSFPKDLSENLSQLEDSIWYHLSNMLQNENINNIIESSQILQSKVYEALIRVNDMYSSYNMSSDLSTQEFYKKKVGSVFEGDDENRIMNAMAAIITDQCISLKHKLNLFFSLLKSELRSPNEDEFSESLSMSNASEDEVQVRILYYF